jgi:hypothetical protein
MLIKDLVTINKKIDMNIITKIKSTAATLLFLMVCSTYSADAQGIYSSKDEGLYSKKDNPISSQVEKGRRPALFREKEGAGGLEGGTPGQADYNPIGDGFLILSLLAGGYFVNKKRKNRK